MSSEATAVVFEQPGQMSVRRVGLLAPGAGDCVVDIAWSGISTGTERLLWTGDMPTFPGMGYPLVPGYEAVGQVSMAHTDSPVQPGDWVFVPGSKGFDGVSGLFGAAADRLVVAADRLVPLGDSLREEGVLLALAATAHRAVTRAGMESLPQLIIGHGVLGRLIARITLALGGDAPVVWDTQASRREGAEGYSCVHPDDDDRKDYASLCDVSGDGNLLDTLVQRMAPGGVITLAGFYHAPLSFQFPPAFMRELSFKISAEWKPEDLQRVMELVHSGDLSLAGLITHRSKASEADPAYKTAFEDAACLKMVIDWRAS